MKKLTNILTGLLAINALSATADEALQTHESISYGQRRHDFAATSINRQNRTLTEKGAAQAIINPYKTESVSHFKEVATSSRNTDKKMYTVKCVFLNANDYPDVSIYNTDMFQQARGSVWMNNNWEKGTYYFEVPAGTYDLSLHLYSHIDGREGPACIVRENLNITDDIEVVFDESELTETIRMIPLLKDGSEAILPFATFIDEDPWIELDYKNATARYISLGYALLMEGCDHPLITYTGAADFTYTEDRPDSFHCNTLSEKYHFIFQYFIEDFDETMFISTTNLTGIDNGEYPGYISDPIKFECPDFAATPLYNEEGIDAFPYPISVSGNIWINNLNYSGGGKYTSNRHPVVYCATQPSSDSSFDIKAPIVLENVQMAIIVDNDGWMDLIRNNISCIPALYNGEKWEYINQNHSQCGNFGYQITPEGWLFQYPGMPSFCYFADDINQPIGNSSPLAVLMTQINQFTDATIFRLWPQAYIGRYGEVRRCDNWNLLSEVKLNGETVYNSSEDVRTLDQWCIENSLDNHEKGIIEATFINSNILVDESITGFNRMTIKVDERVEDTCAPTTQMLIFKNKNNIIIDRFAKAEDGIIEFSAGDFNYQENEEETLYYSCEEAEVKVEYAPYGEQTFLPLEVTEIPENYFMPGFGYFYRGSLKDVAIPSANGWYDLRFTLTDKAGNEMVQHISPAFRIDNNVGVTAPAVNGLKVWAANGTVFAAGDDIASIELLTPDGKRIAYANASSVSSNGHRGIAIVRVTSADGSASTLKTAIP